MYITENYANWTGREYALRIIKDNIIRLELKPGSMVNINDLAAEIGLSRTPVREALMELEKSQIVEIYPQRGSRISLIDYSMIEESCFIRATMEKAIVELACKMVKPEDLQRLDQNIMVQELYLQQKVPNKLLELDNEFHMELYKISNKMQSYQMVQSVSLHFDRIRNMSLNTVKDLKTVDDHKKIVQAIKAGDAELAKQLMDKHLSRYKIDEEAIREKYPEYFK